MADKKTMQARRERRLRRETELRRINDVYSMEVLEDNHEGKGKEED